jgi:hypothetical protein
MRFLSRSISDQWFVAVVGGGLLALSLLGVVHGTRAAVAQACYQRAKYGAAAGDVPEIVRLCRRAYAWYPWNYYFSIEASEWAYQAASVMEGEEARQDMLRQAQFWCERGLIQNPWRSQLRRLKTRFLWETSPSEAIRYWESHTQWQFWEPHNHRVLAELYARAGDFENAEKSLKWTAGTPEFEPARQVVLSEKTAWNEALKENAKGWGE